MSFFKALAIDKMLFCENRQGDTKRHISLNEKLEIFVRFGILFLHILIKFKNKITVLGKKAGSTKIIAKCKGKKYTCKITVKKKKTTKPTVIDDNPQNNPDGEEVTSPYTEEGTSKQTEESTSSQSESTTKYPGQDEGWSPIVTPDDLKKMEEQSTSSAEAITTYPGQNEGWSPIISQDDLKNREEPTT